MASMNGDAASQYKTEQYSTSAPPPADAPASSSLTKDQIGWYFVEQYYNTLSKNAEKLHLFFNKKSQFVHGAEAENLTVSVGRLNIQERIKQLAFNDTKVRISNVDAQEASDGLILIQVIGETANVTDELKKFVQTFILAQQPSGYYVLNSIFRYLKYDLDEEETVAETANEEASESTHTLQDSATSQIAKGEEAAPEPASSEQEEKTATPAAESLPVAQVDEKLEAAIESVSKPATEDEPSTNGAAVTDDKSQSAEPVEVPIQAEETLDAEGDSKMVEAEAEGEKPEVPQDPVPTPTETEPAPVETPAAAPAPAAKVQTPAAPAKPMSWASRAAAAAASAPKPAVPQVKPAVPAVQPRASPAAATAKAPGAAPAPQQQAPVAPMVAPVSENKENDEPKSEGWQSVGENTKKQNRTPQAAAPQSQEKEGCLGYLRNVIESVQADELKAVMSKFGKVAYLDINRAKNCGFIEFEEPTGYQAAFKANPIKVGDIEVYLESRRPKQAGFNNGPQQFNRGGMNQRGRGNFQQGPRGRGDFNNNANRGRGGARGGRGGAGQPVAAS